MQYAGGASIGSLIVRAEELATTGVVFGPTDQRRGPVVRAAAADDPSKVTMLEEWEFQASFEAYALELRGQFLAKVGITSEGFDRGFWLDTGIVVTPDD